ncbi:uncharacterized protein LOC131167502 [Malania oleifera]|uniref:uncharacterized protein LOC131167502 n=1 Tax=Malania oleifera TaxID=397392 RepID=UPI0025AD9FFE|nr:uncharacterized protein LOC131167502 [Malania oleifera]
MEDIIPTSQNAFVRNRQILDPVLIANECLGSGLKTGVIGLLCKLDVEKAFDHVNWGFLMQLLVQGGFSAKWRRQAFFCISTVRFSILINGTPCGFFESSRGLRQGDPLSPLLFVLVMEAQGRMLKKAVHDGHMSGFGVEHIEGRALVVSHLLFADDTLIFCDPDLDHILFLRVILMWFEAVSGLKINWASGLGIRKVRQFNEALLRNWLWRFRMEKAALWRQVIEVKYCYEWGAWCTRPVNGPHGVGLWKNISRGWPSSSCHVLYDIGNGSNVKFWQDHWCGETSLAVSYPDLYRFCRDKEASVAELMKFDNGVLFWDVSFFKGMHLRALEALTSFMDTICGALVKGSGENKMCWKSDREKGFLVKDYRRFR